MKPNVFANVLVCLVVLYATEFSEGILHENNRQNSRGLSRISTRGRKHGNVKGNDVVQSSSKAAGKLRTAGSVLR